jgi:antitoxin component YwqK of YwqJK toxin-antitoxin module
MRIIILLIFCYNLSAQSDTLKTYYKDSILKSISFKKRNKTHITSYFESGKIKSNVILNRDSIPVSIIELNEKGEEVLVQTKNKCTIYDKEYNAIMYFKIKNGVFHGRATTYEDGVLTYEMAYVNGSPEGKAFGYDPVTKGIMAEETYLNGKLAGEGLYYNRGHILSRKIFYENGCPYKAQTFSKEGEVVYETVDKEIIDLKFRSTKDCK